MRRARPVDPSRLDHGRYPARRHPGRYTAPVAVKGEGVAETLTLHLNVTERTLPAPSEWTYHLDLWQHPAAVARAEGVEVWSDEHFERMRPTMRQLADAGQKVITATLNKDPGTTSATTPTPI